MFCPFSSGRGAPPRANATQTEQQRPLNLKHLSEAVRTLTWPPVSTTLTIVLIYIFVHYLCAFFFFFLYTIVTVTRRTECTYTILLRLFVFYLRHIIIIPSRIPICIEMRIQINMTTVHCYNIII